MAMCSVKFPGIWNVNILTKESEFYNKNENGWNEGRKTKVFN